MEGTYKPIQYLWLWVRCFGTSIGTAFTVAATIYQEHNHTSLFDGFSKKVDNLKHAVALHFMYYNFARVHKTLGVTPAMAAGITDHVWTIDEIIALIDNKNFSVSN